MSAPRPPADSLFDDADPLPSTIGRRQQRAPAVRAQAPISRSEPPRSATNCGSLAATCPPSVHLGTSSWSFAGWRGIVYGDSYGESQLSRQGLAAYAEHPVLRAVGLDRSFYQPLSEAEFARHAAQVPPHFRFVVKAPALITDAVRRAEGGLPASDNPSFLDAAIAAEQFVLPAVGGLGECAGPLVFQFSPLPRAMTQGAAAHALIERIGAFLAALPAQVGGIAPSMRSNCATPNC
jgi:uncharacterized protein YecE (DUF72 family)